MPLQWENVLDVMEQDWSLKMSDEKEYIWEPIKIAPNDQSLVGGLMRRKWWDACSARIVDDIGKRYIILNGIPYSLGELDWLILREKPKKKVQYPICPECGKDTIVLFTPPREGIVGTEEGYTTIGTDAYIDWDKAHLYCCNGESNCKIATPIKDLKTPQS